MSEELRIKSMEWAVQAMGGTRTGALTITEEAQHYYDYVLRDGHFAREDRRQAEINRQLWDATKQWRGIVSRIGAASDEQRAAVWEILKDVRPLLDAERNA